MSGNFDDTSRELSLTAENFDDYLNSILHDWLKTLTTLGCALIPAFFILDYFTMPKDLIPRFGIYRLSSTVVFFVQWYIVRRTKASPRSFYHGYVASINAGLTIVLMTVDLGGFDSSYYAGLNLIIMGVNLLLPWKAIYSAINSGSIIAVYLVLNFLTDQAYSFNSLYNHLFFMFSTAIIAVCINHLRYNLVKKEFYLMVELKRARDALWSEMEIAKRIQTALLPERKDFSGFEIAATMLPAKEVGGDYYDIIETPTGERWIAIGDVSGHGVDSGLVMMMAQTSLLSTVNECSQAKPSQVLGSVNSVLRENISRLGSDYYMTMTVIHLNGGSMTVAGKHQDILVHRSKLNRTEVVTTNGTWLGVADKIEEHLEDVAVEIQEGDLVLLFTDGITEASNEEGLMYGQIRLEQAFNRYADLPVGKLLDKIVEQVAFFQEEQDDDMTLIVLKRKEKV